MGLFNWLMLPKSQDDPQTINEAIAEAIAVHEADPESHLGENESLQSHRASTIIDHLAESVLNDKLELQSRAWTAIVALDGSADYTDIQSAINKCVENGGGVVFIRRGTYLLSADLQMQKYVDVQGEGVGETILDFQNSSHNIKAYQKFGYGDKYLDNAVYTNGSKIVTMPAGSKLITLKMVFVGMYVYNENWDEYYLVDSIDSETQLTLHTNFAHANETAPAIFYMKAHFVGGSSVVTFSAPYAIETLGLKAGMNLFVAFTDYDTYKINSVDGETQLTLNQNFGDVTGDYYLSVSEDMPTNNNLEEFTVQNTTADYACEGNEWTTGFNIHDIDFVTVKGIMYANSRDKVNGKISNIHGSSCAGAFCFNIKDYNIYDCNIAMTLSNSQWWNDRSMGNYEINVRGNKVNGGGGSSSYILGCYAGRFYVENNYFNGFQNFAKNYSGAGSKTYGMNFSRNAVYFNKASNVDIDFYNSLFESNDLSHPTNGYMNFPNGASNNRCVNNLLTKAITNNGAYNMLANNHVMNT